MNVLDNEFEHQDERRKITQLFTANVKQVNFYEAKKGAVLGNHYHKETTEYFFVVDGSINYNGTSFHGQGTTFVVYPQENHQITCMTDVKLMTFLTKPFSQEEPDLWKKQN